MNPEYSVRHEKEPMPAEEGAAQVVVRFDLVATRTSCGVTSTPKLRGHRPGNARSAILQATT